jgi:hypothetical protein
MKLKTIVVTVLVLAALSAVAYVARRPEAPASADARVQQPLLEAAKAEKAAKIRFSDAGKQIELARQGDGTWRVTSYHDLPADFGKLSGFIASLTEAKIERLVTSSAERIGRLEFKDTRIDLLDGSGQAVFSVILGKTPETGGGRFVRFGDEQKAYLANLNAWLDTEGKNWANAELLSLKADDIAKVEIPFAEGGPVTVSRAKKEDPWKADKAPTGQQVKADKVAALLGSLGTVRFSETTAPDDAAVAPAKANLRTFKVTTFDNKTVSIALGRKPEEKKLKPVTPATDGKSGPAALGSLADLTKKDDKKEAAQPGAEKKDDKPLAPEFETIPAGPVYAFIAHSEASAPVNALMQKRAYQISEYTFTGLPQKADELFEAAPPAAAPPPAPAAASKPAATK